MIANKTHIQRPETILFVGAGATQCLSMPTTYEQARLLWDICEGKTLRASKIEQITKQTGCFKNQGQHICDLFKVLDGGVLNDDEVGLDDELKKRVFPGVDDETIKTLVRNLRRHYDFSALKLIAKAKKGDDASTELSETYLQEVFTLIDVCLRERRGFAVYDGERDIFLTPERIVAARETLILIINTMFACAWKNLIKSEKQDLIERYRLFFRSLAELMQKEGRRFLDVGCKQNYPEFYQFSYSLMTTNFEPLFLWFIWQAHKDVNKGTEYRIGTPGRQLKLMMNFPNALGMSRLADANEGEKEEELDRVVWTPCTDAAAQAVNNEKYGGNRFYRFGKYFPLHGMCVTRHCPMCGKLNLYMGDSWDKNTPSLFNNGIIYAFNWGQRPRTKKEEACFERGEYDALECHFCGEITHLHDNFMFMQTQLKALPPSFIKEATDEALAGIVGAKHIVLLGYSMPLDDAIWGSLFTAMSRRRNSERLYCTVVDYVEDEGKVWLYGDDLDAYISDGGKPAKKNSRAITNAVRVFGKENVRAYVKGVPAVFGQGTESDVLELMYPSRHPGWRIPEFGKDGVTRRVVHGQLQDCQC